MPMYGALVAALQLATLAGGVVTAFSSSNKKEQGARKCGGKSF